jgi:hypothetical protein
MEIIEVASLENLNLLLKLDLKTFTKLYKEYNNDTKKDKIEQIFNHVINYLEYFQKCDGKRKHLYKQKTYGIGRMCCGTSIQSKPKFIRNFLFKHTTTFDIENAQPNILEGICKEYNINCDNLSLYNKDRIKYLENYKITKLNIIKCLTFGSEMNHKIKEVRELYKEIYNIRELLYNNPDTEKYKIELSQDNIKGSFLSKMLSTYENNILEKMNNYFELNNHQVAVLLYDGILIYGNYYKDNLLLENLNKYVKSYFNNINININFEENETNITLEILKKLPEKINIEQSKGLTFEEVAEEFEKTHLKIINEGLYIRENTNNTKTIMNDTKLKQSYSHMSCLILKNILGEMRLVKTSFINHWIYENDNIRYKTYMGFFPDKTKCPDNTYNLWVDYDMELVNDYEEKNDNLETLLKHMKIICNHDIVVYNYLLCWVAQLIQHPEIKTNMPIFSSKQGAGKGTFFKILRKMLGNKKIFETTQPQRDIWGVFNGALIDCILVIINESEKKKNYEGEGALKGLITDYELIVNQKGTNQFEVQSYHRFAASSNNYDSFNTTTDDRRKWMVVCSDELLNNHTYFNNINEIIEDVDSIKTLYEYFKNFKYGEITMDKFNTIQKPITEQQKELALTAEQPYETWLKEYTIEKLNEGVNKEQLKPKDILSEFNLYKSENKIEYNIVSNKLLVKLLNLQIPEGIGSSIHRKDGNYREFNYIKIAEYYKLNEEYDDLKIH